MRKALVTGANGFIGSAVCRRLLKDGIAVRAMCRTASKGQALAAAGAEIQQGNLQLSIAQLRRYTEGCDVVFHVGAVMNGDGLSQYRVNVLGTRNLAQAAHATGVDRFVHVSSAAVYGLDIEGEIDESHSHHIAPNYYYMQSKSIGERELWRYAEQSGLPTTVIRPAFVYGPGSSLWSRQLYELCRHMPVPYFEDGQGSAHPIYIDDVVDLMMVMATHPAAIGQAFNAAPDPAPTWRKFLGYYAEMAHNPFEINLSPRLLMPLAALITQITRWNADPVDVSGSMRFMTNRVTFRMKRATDLLNWRPQVSLDEGMRRTEQWLKAGLET